MIVYIDAKTAISQLCNLNKENLKKLNNYGMENDGIYAHNDKVFKITASRQEFLAAKRIIGKDFKNIVKIYNSFECYIKGYNDKKWKSYIIEEEKLVRNNFKYIFKDISFDTLCFDFDNRLDYFVAIINGLAELSSIGITYKDLHSLNVMFDANDNLKIIDFGYVSLRKTYKEKEIKYIQKK